MFNNKMIFCIVWVTFIFLVIVILTDEYSDTGVSEIAFFFILHLAFYLVWTKKYFKIQDMLVRRISDSYEKLPFKGKAFFYGIKEVLRLFSFFAVGSIYYYLWVNDKSEYRFFLVFCLMLSIFQVLKNNYNKFLRKHSNMLNEDIKKT